jgi:electron transport complex protein RnfG
MNEIIRMLVVLTAICLLSSYALTALNNGLSERIGQQEEFYVKGPAVMELFEGAPNDPLAEAFDAEVGGTTWRIYPWIVDGSCTAVALETVGKGGYGGDVKVMTAIDFAAGEVVGARITLHAETPGVGTRAADPNYLRTYAKRPLEGTTFALQAAGGDIESVSGATRTSTAVVDAVGKAVQFVLTHRDAIPGWAAANRAGS